jgi:hypothetical protein
MRAAFWLDGWVPSGPLATTMPELFSHCSLQGASVRQVLDHGIDIILALRLSTVVVA